MSNTQGSAGLVAAGCGWGIALGIALGALLLAPAIPGFSGAGVTGSASSDTQDPALAAAEQRAEAANDLLAQESVSIVSGALTDVPVTIVRTDSASNDDVESVRWLLNAAGASDAGELALTSRFTDQGAADELATIVANTLPSGAQLSVDNRAPGRHAGESLGTVLLVNPDTGAERASASDRALVLDTLQQAGFVDYTGSVVPAGAVVIVDGAAEAAGGAFGHTLVKDFAAALGEQGKTVLASQDTAPADIGGVRVIGAVDTETGRIASVLAAAE